MNRMNEPGGLRWWWNFAWSASLVVTGTIGATVVLLSSGWTVLQLLVLGAATYYLGHLIGFHQQPWWLSARRVAALTVGPALVVVWGWSLVLGWWAAWLTAATILSSPGVVSQLARTATLLARPPGRYPPRCGSPALEEISEPSPHPPAALTARLPVDLLTDSGLCLAWRQSFLALQRAQVAPWRTDPLRLVVVRQLYLDELERRNPAGFAHWLAEGARPASDPSRYFHRTGSPTTPHPRPTAHRPNRPLRSTET